MIKVKSHAVSTGFHIHRALSELMQYKVIAFDTEAQGIYSKQERKEAKDFLKIEGTDVTSKQLALQVADNSGLSFPALVKVTHFIFGLSEDFSVVVVCTTPKMEKMLWQWVADYPGKLIIHNTMYDLKLMYNRVKCVPQDFEDTALLAKSLINNTQTWKAKVGLKELMGGYYDPSWLLMNDYEPEDLLEPKFISYAAIDGAALFKLWIDLNDHVYGDDWEKPEAFESFLP